MNSNSSAVDELVCLYSAATDRQKGGVALMLARSLCNVLRDTYRSGGEQRLVDGDGIIRGHEVLIRLMAAASRLVLPGSVVYPDNSLLAFLEEYRQSDPSSQARLQQAAHDVNRQLEALGGIRELL
ncbi:MAG: hypothetical protein IAE78_00140 [Myxococcus sp.]|nr:hypothetical protein [Myxococcus sp.]